MTALAALVLSLLPSVSDARAAGVWLPASPLEGGRKGHTATPLPNGDVLVAGGEDAAGALPKPTLLFHPPTRTVSPGPSLAAGRTGHTATALPDGRVLVAGGHDGAAPLASAELYDPARGTFSKAGSLAAARHGHTATLLPGGKVLIAGGEGAGGPLASAELFDPATGRFSPAKPMGSARTRHAAAPLPGGKVLIAGGRGETGATASAEIYDPSRGAFSPAGAMAAARELPTATPLPDGRVLVAGGESDGRPLATAERYDPSRNWFEAAVEMASPRAGHASAPLPGGKVLLAGGNPADHPGAETYDPASGSFAAVRPAEGERRGHTATPLSGGKVLVAGGEGQKALSSCELYLPPRPVFDADGDGKTDLALWRPSTGSWLVKPSAGAPSSDTRWGEQKSGDVPVPGDYDGDGKLDLAFRRPATGEWHVKPASGAPSFVLRGIDGAPGDLPVPGDYDGDGSADIAVWRAETGIWAYKVGNATPVETRWGDPASGDLPVPGDYDGDGATDLAFWRPKDATWHVKPSSGGVSSTTQWGTPDSDEIPVPGDYDGDGRTDYALYRPANGTWNVKPASGASSFSVQWGVNASGDVPVAGDYDGDGRIDAAVFRASNATWYVKPASGAATTTTQWGSGGGSDKPLNRSLHQWTHLPPAAPASLSAEGGDGRITLTWPAVAGAVGYRVYWSAKPGVTKASGTRLTAPRSPYEHAGVPPGAEYFYVVTAVGPGAQESGPSPEAGARTAGPPVVRVDAADVGQYFDRAASAANFHDNSSHPLRGATSNDSRLRFAGTQNCLLCHAAEGSGRVSDECLLCHFENQPNAPAENHRDGTLQLASVPSSGSLPTDPFPVASLPDYDAFCLQCHQRTTVTLGGRSPSAENRSLIDPAAWSASRHRANGSGCIHCHDPHGSGNTRLVRKNPVNRAAAPPVPTRFGVFPADNTGAAGYPPNQSVAFRSRVDLGYADSQDATNYCNKACHIARLDGSWSKERTRKRDEATGLYVLAPGNKKISLINGREYTFDNATSPRIHAHVNNEILPTDAMVDWFNAASGNNNSRFHYPRTQSSNPADFRNGDSPIPFYPDHADGSRDFLDGYLNVGRLKYRFTCVTCHDPHGSPFPSTNGPSGASYPDLRMRRTNPDSLCRQCHP